MTNHNGSITDAVCTFYNGSDFVSATDYLFTQSVEVNVSCTSATLGVTLSENVSVSVVEAEVVNYDNFRTFDTFELEYRNVNFTPSALTCANVTLIGVGVANYSGDYCAWNVSYTNGVNELVNITSVGFSANYSKLINVTQGRVYFDVRDVLGEFVVDLNYISSIVSNSSFLGNRLLDDNSYTYGLQDLVPEFPTNNQFSFTGDIFSSKSELEFVN